MVLKGFSSKMDGFIENHELCTELDCVVKWFLRLKGVSYMVPHVQHQKNILLLVRSVKLLTIKEPLWCSIEPYPVQNISPENHFTMHRTIQDNTQVALYVRTQVSE